MRNLISLWILLITVSIAAANEQPNIVFIIADDLRYDLLHCNGHPRALTPNIDRLAKEGANFRQFFATTPLCSPSRASFLTGLYPHSHRVINNDDQALSVRSHRLMSFPRVLREEAGYTTAWVGKWHMGFDDSRRPGFDHWISFRGQGQFIDPVVNDNGMRRQTRGYLTDLITDWSVDFLNQNRQRPFCLVVSHEAVHRPFIPAKRHENLFRDVTVAPVEVNQVALQGKRALTRKMPATTAPSWFTSADASPEPGEPRRGRSDDLQSIVQDQLRCLASVDEGVGRILSALQSRGILDETIVIFTSDQGYTSGEFGLKAGKRWPYDPCLRIPFIMRYPPLAKPGSQVDEMVLNVDLTPTLLSIVGVQWHTPFHGRSFEPILRSGGEPWRQAALFEYFLEKVTPRCPRYSAIRTTEWKYIYFPDFPEMDELYDLQTDPDEVWNVVHKRPKIVKQMRQQLLQLNRDTQNPFAVFSR